MSMAFECFALETILCVYACFFMFYVFIVDDIYVRGPKIMYEHSWVL